MVSAVKNQPVPVGKNFTNIRSTLTILNQEQIQKILMKDLNLPDLLAENFINNLNIVKLEISRGEIIRYTDSKNRTHPFPKNLNKDKLRPQTQSVFGGKAVKEKKETPYQKPSLNNIHITGESPYMNPHIRLRERQAHQRNSIGG